MRSGCVSAGGGGRVVCGLTFGASCPRGRETTRDPGWEGGWICLGVAVVCALATVFAILAAVDKWEPEEEAPTLLFCCRFVPDFRVSVTFGEDACEGLTAPCLGWVDLGDTFRLLLLL